MKAAPATNKSKSSGHAAPDSYASILNLLTESPAELLFIRNVRGVEQLFQTISAVGAAVSGAVDEEWNPLSQRPHTPLPPTPSHALGVEIWALKEAVDTFTTLAHEMMHVALWEPFFVGRWRPRGRQEFTEFSLLGEGYSFFFSDIIVSRAVRVRLPDGEYALERQTSENARFHPSRAFQALGIERDEEILDVYLDGFRGRQTRLWQPRGASAHASSLAAQVHDFYQGSLLPLHEMHVGLTAFGGITELYKRFCAVPGLPTFLPDGVAPAGPDLKTYFADFFRSGLQRLATLPVDEIARIRRRRALQMRAYFALQVRWLLTENLIAARGLSAPRRAKLAAGVDGYLDGLEGALRSGDDYARLDVRYDRTVRQPLAAHDVWVAKRWMVVPRRAGGLIDTLGRAPVKAKDTKVQLLKLAAFLVDELTRRVRLAKTVEERTAVMARIQRVAALGAAGTRGALRSLQRELLRPDLRDVWSVPLASVDPADNRFRELVFSYQ